MKVALLGDMALFGKYSVGGNPRVYAYFEKVAGHLKEYDVVVGNLETPFGGNDIKPKGAKSAYIKADPRDVELLKLLGVNIVNLANNHLFDYGVEGCRETVKVLASNGIDWFGLGDRQVEFTEAGVAFHGYCSFNTNPLGVGAASGGINPLNVANVEARMRENDARGLLNIVSIHSGIEHVHQPSRDDIRMARRLARICPYVYYGHHPHVVQGVEEPGGSVIAYSLGNFCFDDVYTDKSPFPLVKQTRSNRTGLIVGLDIVEGRITSRQFTSVYSGEHEMTVGDADGDEALAAHSALLDLPEAEYDALRHEQVSRISERWRSARDMRWYLKRLNLRTVELVVRGRINRHLYRRNVTSILDAE